MNFASFWWYNDAKTAKHESYQTVLTVVLIAWNTCFHRSRYANKQSSKIANFYNFNLASFWWYYAAKTAMNLFKLFLPLYSSLETHVFTVTDTQINKVQKLQICRIWTLLHFDDIMMRKQQSVNLFKLFLPLYFFYTCFHSFSYANKQSSKIANL